MRVHGAVFRARNPGRKLWKVLKAGAGPRCLIGLPRPGKPERGSGVFRLTVG